MKNDINNNYVILDGNTVRVEAPAEKGRVHMEGSGAIHCYVSLNGVNYTEVEQTVGFDDGVVEFPIRAYMGDHLKFTADSITKFEINWTYIDRR